MVKNKIFMKLKDKETGKISKEMADENSNDLLNCWDVLESREAIETVLNLINNQQKKLEKEEEYIQQLEQKLMFALAPTEHEIDIQNQKKFKEIIRSNMDKDTYTIKDKLKKYWEEEG